MPIVTNPQFVTAVLIIVVLGVLAALWLLRPVDRYGYKHLYNALKETTFDSVFLLNDEGQIKAVNEVAVGVFGQTVDSMLDQSLSSFFVREDEGHYAGVVEAGALLEKDFYRNSRTIHALAIGPGQQEFHAEVRVRPVFGGLQPRFVVVVREVVPKASVGRSLTASDQKYRRIFNQDRSRNDDSIAPQSRVS